MRSREDLEAYLLRSARPFLEVESNTWLVREHDDPHGDVVVKLENDLVFFRSKVLDLSTVKRPEELFRRLLELNASDMFHGAYGLTENAVVLTSALRLENLDYNELQGTLDDFSLALSNHRDTLQLFAN